MGLFNLPKATEESCNLDPGLFASRVMHFSLTLPTSHLGVYNFTFCKQFSPENWERGGLEGGSSGTWGSNKQAMNFFLHEKHRLTACVRLTGKPRPAMLSTWAWSALLCIRQFASSRLHMMQFNSISPMTQYWGNMQREMRQGLVCPGIALKALELMLSQSSKDDPLNYQCFS